ncbi:unnamed protein product [Adineta steineri]|uniref:WD repeat-containing protein 4 homolog n=1 Tax=Adineta steineri TaxID=433720 RepID=A0A818VYG6_9BILA|nr:unnamed protein product [Adineta steineri]
MPEIAISSTGWLAICLRNGIAGIFHMKDTSSWQYLQSESKSNDLNRNLIKFSPNGQVLIVTGENKQLNVYIAKNEFFWQLQKIIIVEKFITALDLTNEFLFIVNKNGDIHKIDLLFNDNNKHLILTDEYCIMKHSSMILDMISNESFILIADQNKKICLNSYPDISQNQSYSLGHTEFVSHLKLIDNYRFLSASGDGTFRLWSLPDCKPLVFIHSKIFVLLSKEIFYTQLFHSENQAFIENYRLDSKPDEFCSDPSSIINYSIWKMDIASFNSNDSNIYIAFSIYFQRLHSIYLTTLLNMKELINEQRKLIFDSSYGTIIDYCFSSKQILHDDYITDSKCYLYILFDSNTLLKIDVISILSCDKTELFIKPDEDIQEINNILARKEFHSINNNNNTTVSDDILYKELFKNHLESTDNCCSKRKNDRTDQEQRKKQICSQMEENISIA